MGKNIAIIGTSGAIGSSLLLQLYKLYPDATIHSFSRQKPEIVLPDLIFNKMDYQNETSIENSALIASRVNPLDIVIVPSVNDPKVDVPVPCTFVKFVAGC